MTIALVLGGAKCVWSDIEAALDMLEFDGVVACNDVGAEWRGRLDAWVSLHPEKQPKWNADRLTKGYSPANRILTHHKKAKKFPLGEEVDYMFRGQKHSGSSGQFAAKIALDHFDKAVLCGIPMTNSEAHFFNPKLWEAARHYRLGWTEAKPVIGDRLRSMSGWTREQFGAPTVEWANQ